MAEVQIIPQFSNPQPNDSGADTYVKPKHWNETRKLAGGSVDGDLVTWEAGAVSKAAFRALVGGSGITVTVTATQIQVAGPKQQWPQ